jgi:hypothetical protein
MLNSVSGTVLVNGRNTKEGDVLNEGDVIETQAGAIAMLGLSDGSEIHLGEKTQISFAELNQTVIGRRLSSIKLFAGRLRIFLSFDYQQEGSSFSVETPNAQLGVKFSEPDIEVSYNPEKAETVGIAYTVELLAKNLLTDEEVLVPVGSTVIIGGTTVKIVAGILAIAGATEAGTTGTGATSAGTSSKGSSGMGTGTKIALGVGAAAAALGGGIALVVSPTDGDDNDRPSVKITSHSNGFQVNRIEHVFGIAKDFKTGDYVSIIIYSYGDNQSYPHDEPGLIDENGNWTVGNCYFGREGDIDVGVVFEIQAYLKDANHTIKATHMIQVTRK